MARFIFKCNECGASVEAGGYMFTEAQADKVDYVCCDKRMKRDYRAESATATFKGGGWARKSN